MWRVRRSVHHSTALAIVIIMMLAVMMSGIAAQAEDLEARAYSAAPIGTNFLILGYSYSGGAVSLDPSLPVTDVHASINAGKFGYEHTFGLWGETASLAVLLPYLHGNLTGQVGDQSRAISRSGFNDITMRFAWNFIGDPALTPEQFARRKPTTTVGVSVAVVAPTGAYNPAYLINVGSNRWAFKPEIGVEHPMGKWFADGSAGVWLFTNNNDFFGGQKRAQEPVSDFQVHAGYNFRPGLWLAADGTYYTGGMVSVNGVATHDILANSRYGLTLSTPLSSGFSTKLAYSNWLSGQLGSKFATIGLTLQYRWFDR